MEMKLSPEIAKTVQLNLPDEVIFERIRIPIQLSEFTKQIKIKEDRIVALEQQVSHLNEELGTVYKELGKLDLYRELTDEQAQEEIKKLILNFKKIGETKIDIIDLVENLDLPPEQIERVMNNFSKLGKVRELDA